MKLSINSVIQLLLTAGQAVNASTDLLPGKAKFWGLVAASAIQGVLGILAHFSNPDGTSAKTAYTPATAK